MLTGDVNPEHIRTGAEKVASMVPNVKQVVNALRLVKYRKPVQHNINCDFNLAFAEKDLADMEHIFARIQRASPAYQSAWHCASIS
jgi:hypothetical protein